MKKKKVCRNCDTNLKAGAKKCPTCGKECQMGFDQTPNEPTVSYTPQPKVVAAGIGGAVAVIVVWALQTFANIQVPAEVAAAFATVLSFASGYIKKGE